MDIAVNIFVIKETTRDMVIKDRAIMDIAVVVIEDKAIVVIVN